MQTRLVIKAKWTSTLSYAGYSVHWKQNASVKRWSLCYIWDYLRLNVTSLVSGYSDQDRKELTNEVSLCLPELDLEKKKNGR